MTWNVHGSAKPNPAALVEVIARHDVDIACLQEIRPGQARKVARQLGWNVFWSRKHLPYSIILWWRAEGLAIMSPYELTATSKLDLTPRESIMSFRNRIAQFALVRADDDRALSVINTHLGSGENPAERVRQAQRLAQHFETAMVLAGDLNAPNEPEVLNELKALGVHDAWIGTDELGYTSEAATPRQRIDYIMVGAAATEVLATVEPGGPQWDRLSDHLPLAVGFTL